MIDTDKCMKMYNDNRGWYVETIGDEKELISALYTEVERLRKAIADIANNMEAADASYMGGFIEDLWKVIE